MIFPFLVPLSGCALITDISQMGINKSSGPVKCFMMTFTGHTDFFLFSLTCLIVLDFTEEIVLSCVLSVGFVCCCHSVSHVQLFATPWK